MAEHVRSPSEYADSDTAVQEHFPLLVDAVREYAIFLLDPDGTVASWNA